MLKLVMTFSTLNKKRSVDPMIASINGVLSWLGCENPLSRYASYTLSVMGTVDLAQHVLVQLHCKAPR